MKPRLMASFALALVSASSAPALWPAAASAQKAILLVRHAEKVDESEDSSLSQLGRERAQALARVLAGAGITAIVATEYRRSQQTAEPLARALKLKPAIVKAEDVEAVMKELKSRKDDVILVVGHSHTLPLILKALGHAPEVSIARGEYDNLFVLTPRPEGAPLVLRLRL